MPQYQESANAVRDKDMFCISYNMAHVNDDKIVARERLAYRHVESVMAEADYEEFGIVSLCLKAKESNNPCIILRTSLIMEASESASSFANKHLNEYFNFNPVANKMEDRNSGCSVILTNEERWDAIQDGLYNRLQDSWSIILFQTGLECKTNVCENVLLKLHNIRHAVKFLELYGLVSDWGEFTSSALTLSTET
jgi:hypothetical protein